MKILFSVSIAKINDTVNFGEEEEDDNIIEFDEVSGDEDIENVSNFKIHFEIYSMNAAKLGCKISVCVFLTIPCGLPSLILAIILMP